MQNRAHDASSRARWKRGGGFKGLVHRLGATLDPLDEWHFGADDARVGSCGRRDRKIWDASASLLQRVSDGDRGVPRDGTAVNSAECR